MSKNLVAASSRRAWRAKASPAWGRGASAPSPHTHRHPSFRRPQARAPTQGRTQPRCAGPAGSRRPAAEPGGEEAAWATVPLPPSLQPVLGSLAGCGGAAALDPGSPTEQSKPCKPQASYPPQASAISEFFVVDQWRPSSAGSAWPPAGLSVPTAWVLGCTSPGATAL